MKKIGGLIIFVFLFAFVAFLYADWQTEVQANATGTGPGAFNLALPVIFLLLFVSFPIYLMVKEKTK